MTKTYTQLSLLDCVPVPQESPPPALCPLPPASYPINQAALDYWQHRAAYYLSAMARLMQLQQHEPKPWRKHELNRLHFIRQEALDKIAALNRASPILGKTPVSKPHSHQTPETQTP
jgi:hypothetical protein